MRPSMVAANSVALPGKKSLTTYFSDFTFA